MALLFGTMAAYAIARLDFPGKKAIVGAALLIAMFPQIALVTPLFKIETSLGLFDTWLGLIIPYITFALPLAIYTLSAFFREIPWELEKAGRQGSDVYAYFSVQGEAAHAADLEALAADTGQDMTSMEQQMTARLDAAAKVAADHDAELWYDTSKMHIFDANTGVKLTADDPVSA